MILHILIFDDDLGAVHGHITKALTTYVGKEICVPDFKIGDSLTLKIPAMKGHPSVELSFVANSNATKSGIKVAKQIKDGVFNDTPWDAVIVDNNWNAQKKNNRDGCEYVLPALLESPHFKQHRPEYLLFTWHFADDAYYPGIEEELAGWRSVAEIRPIAKNELHQLSHWFGYLISARVAARTGNGATTTSGEATNARKAPPKHAEDAGKRGKGVAKYSVEVKANGTFTVDGKLPADEGEPRIQGELHTWLLFLFFLGEHGVGVKRNKEVKECNTWLSEKLRLPVAQRGTPRLSMEIMTALSGIAAFSESLQIKSGSEAGKAWRAFRVRYDCGGTAGDGAKGNAPETILRSIKIAKFALPLKKFESV